MDFLDQLSQVLGIYSEPKELTVLQVCLRAMVVFVATLIIVRLAEKRFLARLNALDAILGFILASMLARAINGSGPLIPTLVAGFVMAILHRLMASAACRWHSFSNLVKGREEVIIEDGKVVERVRKKNHISHGDLIEELRLNGKTESVDRVKKAVVERRGEISVLPME